VRESRPKVLFLTSPNNPDGSMIAEADLLELLALPVCLLRPYQRHQPASRRHFRMVVMQQQFFHISCGVCIACWVRGQDSEVSVTRSRIASICCQVLVVLDEAYIEFSEEQSRLGWPARYDNLVVLRTFSKSAGLAGELVITHAKN